MWSTLADGTSARCTSTSHTEERMENQREGKPGGHKSVFLVRIDSCQHRDNLKTYGSCRKHNRCVVDAGRFHCPVIDIPPHTICPRCDFIFNDTAELQRHLASVEYPPPEGHSLEINAETSVGACGSDLWQKIRDRWRARRAKRETKTHQTAAWRDKGRRDAKLHNAVLKTLCVLSQQVREVRGAVFMCWLKKTRGARVQETERAITRLRRTGGDQGQGTGPWSARDSGFYGPAASAVGEMQHSGSGQRGWSGQPQANVGRSGTGGAFDLVPNCKLAKVYDPALSRLELV